MGVSLVGRPITLENTLHVHYILLSRVAGKLQRVWRWRCLRMRLNTLANIAKYVSKIDSARLFMEQTIYNRLEQLFKRVAGAPWHKEHSLSTLNRSDKAIKKQTVLSK